MPTRHRLTATVACAPALLLAVPPAHASLQSEVAALVNAARSQQGLAALTCNADMDAVAQAWAEHLAETGELAHNPSYASQIPGGWRSAAENVASQALDAAANPEPTETASEPTEVAEEETPEPPATRAAAAARTAVVSDVVPTDAGPPPADDEGGPRTGALVGVLAAAIAALAALLVVRRRLVRS